MKSLLKNWEIKVLAVAAAVIFWFLVVGTENSFYMFPEEITVKPFNLSEDLVVSNDLGKVKLRLKIENRDIIQNLVPENFNVYVDLQGVKEGEHDVEIEVASKKAEVNVLKAEPSTVKVKIEKRQEKEVPVDYKLNGQPKEGYEVKNVDINTETVVIKGAKDLIEGIDKAVIQIDLDGESKNIKASFPVAVINENGETIEGISVANQEIEAEVEISLVSGQKLLGVQPNITGNPKENMYISAINVEPSYLVLSGDMDAIGSLNSLMTQPVNVDGLSEDKTFEVGVADLPQGVLIEGNSTVMVSVSIEQYTDVDSGLKKKTLTVPLEINKFKGNQLDIKIEPPSVTLVIEGEPSELSKISDRDFKIELDISEFEGKTATIQLASSDINLPSGVKFVNLQPSQVTVSWKN